MHALKDKTIQNARHRIVFVQGTADQANWLRNDDNDTISHPEECLIFPAELVTKKSI